MNTFSGIYIPICLLLIFALSAAGQIRQHRKRLRQYREDARARTQAIQNHINRADKHGIEQQLRRHHQDNAWAREELNKHGFDREDTRSTKRKWLEFIVFGIIPLIWLFIALDYRKHAEERAFELAQDPANLIHGCMYYKGKTKSSKRKLFVIEGNNYDEYSIQIKKAPATQKIGIYHFKKNSCYPIVYVKMTSPTLEKEIYVYDIL